MAIKFYLTDSSHIDSIEQRVGNLIFSKDDRKIYLDDDTGRTIYEQIMSIKDDATRVIMTPNLVSGFYFVLETNILWRLDKETWYQITEKPSEQLVYGALGAFPRPGKVGVIYYTDTQLYHWNPDTQAYEDYCNATPQWVEEN